MASKRILVINFGGIGDQILFFPVLTTLKKVFNDAFITFVTEQRSKGAVKLTRNIDEIYIRDLKGRNKLFEAIKLISKAFFGRYDMVVSSGSSALIPILLFLTGIKERIGYDSGMLSRLLLTRAVPLKKQQYASNMYHDLVAHFDNEREVGLPELQLSISEDIMKYIDGLLAGNTDGKRQIVIHPGVSKLSIQKKVIKFWDEANWLELIKKLLSDGRYRVILTGGPDDREIYASIRKNLSEIGVVQDSLLDLSEEKLGIDEFAYIVSKSDLLVCVDSAPMHIAVGLKKPVVAIFGPTDEKKLLPTYNNLFIPVKNDSVQCRPCLWDKRQVSCDKRDCLNISVEQVFDAVAGIVR